jgi:hypothetical protein
MKRVKFKDIEQTPILKSKKFKQEFQGSAPSPFIGRFGYGKISNFPYQKTGSFMYPKVNIGILSPQFFGDMENYDSPKLWAKNNETINNIANNRFSLVNSRTQWKVKELNGKFLSLVQETAMAKIASEVEIILKKPPKLLVKEKEILPFGPGSEIVKARITSNTKIDSRVENK